MAVDSSNSLYVANCLNCSLGAAAYVSGTDTIYPPNATTASKTITNGVSAPASLAIDSRAVLHVSNSGANTVTEYPANYKVTNPPKHTLSVQEPFRPRYSPGLI
jgi:hypothetical protein